MRTRKCKKGLLIASEAVLFLIFLIVVVQLARRIISDRRIFDEERQAKDVYLSVLGEEKDSTCSTSELEIQSEIKELMLQNEDAVGLLHFEGDKTLYVCQTTDNAYYITHRFDKSEDPAGMIYMDFRCTLNPVSDNLVLYGHNMKNGSRFGTLKRFESVDHIRKYPVFTLAGRYETVEYIPFAVLHTSVDMENPFYYPFDKINFPDEKEFQRYVEDVKNRSVVDLDVAVQYGDRLLTLVTCHSGIERGRLIIVLREIKQGDEKIFNKV